MALKELIDNKIVPFISLSKFDESWCRILNESSVFGIWLKLKLFCQKLLAPLAGLGGIFEIGSMLLMALLFFILPAPQFADDKNLLALLVLGAFACRIIAMLLSSNVASYKPYAIDTLVLAFAAMNVVATAASHYLEPSIKGLSKMAVYFFSYFLFMGVLQKSTRNRSMIIMMALLTAGVAVSLYGIWQWKNHVAPLATWEDPNVEDKTVRVYSTLKNPNLLAGYLIPLVTLGLGSTIVAFCSKGWKRFLSLPLLGATVVIATCCYFTGSRGGWAGLAAALAAFGLLGFVTLWSKQPKLRPLLVLTAIVIPIGIALASHQSPKFEHRLLSIFAGREDSSNSYRLNVYTSSLKMFKDSWWLGIGPGNSTFELAYGLYMRSRFDALGTYCVPLEVGVETGVVGLGIFAWLVLGALARAHQNFWENRTMPERWLAASAAAGLIGVTVHGFVDTVFYRPQVQFLFWLLLALCICSGKDTLKAERLPEPASQSKETHEDYNAAA